MNDDLVDQILDIAAQFPREKAKKLILSLFDEIETTATIASQIKVTSKPGQESPIDFRKIGHGYQKGTGKAFDIFDIQSLADRHPHENGRALTDDELKARIDAWNAEAKRTLKS